MNRPKRFVIRHIDGILITALAICVAGLLLVPLAGCGEYDPFTDSTARDTIQDAQVEVESELARWRAELDEWLADLEDARADPEVDPETIDTLQAKIAELQALIDDGEAYLTELDLMLAEVHTDAEAGVELGAWIASLFGAGWAGTAAALGRILVRKIRELREAEQRTAGIVRNIEAAKMPTRDRGELVLDKRRLRAANQAAGVESFIQTVRAGAMS